MALKKQSFSRPQLLVFALAFALIGLILVRTFAANPNLPGDINNDNSVNITDLSILLTNYGTTNTVADLNADNLVNITDLSILLSHYGQSYTVSPTTISQTITNGSTISGTITWLATTSNDANVSSVDFYLDGVFRNTEASAPYASSDPPQTDEGLVDTTKLANGAHTFKAVANLKDGTTATNSVTATVNNTTASPACSKYAATNGSDSNSGTLASPYLTPQKLVDNLNSGQTGCMRQGAYRITGSGTFGMTFNHGGAPGSPITLTSYPNEKAEITSNAAYNYMILVPAGSNYVTLTNLKITVTSGANGMGPLRINGSNATLSNSELTDNYVGGECLLLGGSGSGETISNVHVVGNIFHDCGQVSSGNKDHCIYASHISSGLIEHNILYNCAAYTIQLYPDAENVVFDHNVSDGGTQTVRGGLVFGGESAPVSSNNTVTNNIITYSAGGALGITGSWGGPLGTGNVANNNCLYQAIVDPNGFTASGNITASSDPFNNRATHDYTVKAGSVCAGKGA